MTEREKPKHFAKNVDVGDWIAFCDWADEHLDFEPWPIFWNAWESACSSRRYVADETIKAKVDGFDAQLKSIMIVKAIVAEYTSRDGLANRLRKVLDEYR